MSVQCESQFCLHDEIMVRKKDDCCIQCRKPTYCTINSGLQIKENEFWTPKNVTTFKDLGRKVDNSCQVCQCINGDLECYSKSCQSSRFPSYAHVKVKIGRRTEISAKTIPFFADIIKSMKKDSLVFIASGPNYSQLKLDDQVVHTFTLGDIMESRIHYQFDAGNIDFAESVSQFDYVTLVFVGVDDGDVHSVLIVFEIEVMNEKNLLVGNYNRQMRNPFDRQVRGNDLLRNNMAKVGGLKVAPRKTIFVHPGEAIKLTSSELKPKNLSATTDGNNLIYFLVSGNLKYGK